MADGLVGHWMTHHSQLGIPGEGKVSLNKSEGRCLGPWMDLIHFHPVLPQMLQNPQRSR